MSSLDDLDSPTDVDANTESFERVRATRVPATNRSCLRAWYAFALARTSCRWANRALRPNGCGPTCGGLPRRQRQVVALHYVERLTLEEIAGSLEISKASANTHLRRARATLSRRINKEDLQ